VDLLNSNASSFAHEQGRGVVVQWNEGLGSDDRQNSPHTDDARHYSD
jgi:hypothetical protein